MLTHNPNTTTTVFLLHAMLGWGIIIHVHIQNAHSSLSIMTINNVIKEHTYSQSDKEHSPSEKGKPYEGIEPHTLWLTAQYPTHELMYTFKNRSYHTRLGLWDWHSIGETPITDQRPSQLQALTATGPHTSQLQALTPHSYRTNSHWSLYWY